jgi:hypothetical protein
LAGAFARELGRWVAGEVVEEIKREVLILGAVKNVFEGKADYGKYGEWNGKKRG